MLCVFAGLFGVVYILGLSAGFVLCMFAGTLMVVVMLEFYVCYAV